MQHRVKRAEQPRRREFRAVPATGPGGLVSAVAPAAGPGGLVSAVAPVACLGGVVSITASAGGQRHQAIVALIQLRRDRGQPPPGIA